MTNYCPACGREECSCIYKLNNEYVTVKQLESSINNLRQQIDQLETECERIESLDWEIHNDISRLRDDMGMPIGQKITNRTISVRVKFK